LIFTRRRGVVFILLLLLLLLRSLLVRRPPQLELLLGQRCRALQLLLLLCRRFSAWHQFAVRSCLIFALLSSSVYPLLQSSFFFDLLSSSVCFFQSSFLVRTARRHVALRSLTRAAHPLDLRVVVLVCSDSAVMLSAVRVWYEPATR
jgi:hypothetical protein